jgi:predicted transcriptional regulator
MAKRSSSARSAARKAPRLKDTVRLSAAGLAKVLGDLEARVMRAVWDIGAPAPAKVVHARVAKHHKVALLTVVTVLNNLVGKGLLWRERRDDLLHYQAQWTEDEFMAHASRRVVEGVLSFEPGAVATSLVEVLAERHPERLADLGRLIRRRLREQDGSRRKSREG